MFPPTMTLGNIYPQNYATTQERTNPPAGMGMKPSASATDWTETPVLGGMAGQLGLPVPALIAMGVLAWWLFRQYD